MRRIVFYVMMVLFGLAIFSPVSGIAADGETRAVIDWTKSDGKVNRAIFSTQGFMQVYVEPNPMVMETFKLINPSGTHTRLETYIHRMEPENDDGDPNHFNWDKLEPEKMIRFIDDRAPFEKTLDRLGLDRLMLLCYQAPWNRSGDPNDPIKSKDEWVEFAAAVVETYNGSGHQEEYRLNLRYVEVWNEPNMEMFYTGTMDSYFELFDKTADRIHRDYPGVMVGGPALTHAYHCAPEEWMKAFLERCAPKADYISYHHYGPEGEPVNVLTDDVRRWASEFRKIPGKEQGKVMLTELDAWYHGWPKAQHILERQFRFLDLSDLILGIHHFCCLAYREAGSYTFGIVDKEGAVLGGTFWPYWLFRNLTGEQAYFIRQGPNAADFDLAASHSEQDGRWLGTAVFHNRTDKPLPIKTDLFFPPHDKDRVLAYNRITEKSKGISKVERIPAGAERKQIDLVLSPGEGLALNLQESGERHYAFRDMNCQEQPWVELTAEKSNIGFLETCELEVRVLNTNFGPLSGMIEIAGLPQDWRATLMEGDPVIESLDFGESRTCRYRFQASSLTESGRVAPYAVFVTATGRRGADLTRTAHSIPVSIEVQSPILTQVLPLPVHAVRCETNQVALQIVSQTSKALEGTFEFVPPKGCKAAAAPGTFRIEPKARKRFQFPFEVARDASLGSAKGSITLSFLGTKATQEFTVEIGDEGIEDNAMALDLSEHLNFDAVAFFSNRTDYDSDSMGLFVYPADFTPSDRIVNIRGVAYRLASLEDGKKNTILPQGQRLPVPGGQYRGVTLMGFGHSGKHPGAWTFHYTMARSNRLTRRFPSGVRLRRKDSRRPSLRRIDTFRADRRPRRANCLPGPSRRTRNGS